MTLESAIEQLAAAGKIRWQCQCGQFGWMRPKDHSLAGLVRQATAIHSCPDPDIEYLETEDEHYRRIHPQRQYDPLVKW